MSSVLPHIKTIASENAYFVLLAGDFRKSATGAAPGNAGNQILNSGVAAGTNVTGANVSFSTAVWSSQGEPSTLINAQGKMLRDMGKTIVSSLRTFRKVQAVAVSATNGSSVGAAVGSLGSSASGAPTQVPGEEFLTGYIEIVGSSGYSASANPAAVARMG
jgi:hypothetical protein